MHYVWAVEEGDREGGHDNPACHHEGYDAEDKQTIRVGKLVRHRFTHPCLYVPLCHSRFLGRCPFLSMYKYMYMGGLIVYNGGEENRAEGERQARNID